MDKNRQNCSFDAQVFSSSVIDWLYSCTYLLSYLLFDCTACCFIKRQRMWPMNDALPLEAARAITYFKFLIHI